MEVKDMDFRDYCGLNRARFQVDPEADAEWFFGNRKVNDELLTRVVNDMDMRGTPKCCLFGRFGCGKTHTLYYLKHIFEKYPESYPAIGVFVNVAPYDESTPNLGGWKYMQGKMLDEIGEDFLRQLIRDFEKLPVGRTAELATLMKQEFKFGDENLRRSLANVFCGQFLREMKSTAAAWQWLKGAKVDKTDIADLGVTKLLENASDMVNVLMNIGALVRKTYKKSLVFLMDESQALMEVDKRETEIHHAFLQMASDFNQDVGFIIAYFGDTIQSIPPVISTPPDILSRMGVTIENLDEAIINLMKVIDVKKDMESFVHDILKGTKNQKKSEDIIKEFGLGSKVSWEQLPFERDALNRAIDMLWQSEATRNPRMIINQLANLQVTAYHKAKADDKYLTVDVDFVNSTMKL